jgi:hypothetical protein
MRLSVCSYRNRRRQKKADNAHYSDAVTAKKQFNHDIYGGEPGTNAIQKSYASGLDVSPQATSDRIVQFSTAFLVISR